MSDVKEIRDLCFTGSDESGLLLDLYLPEDALSHPLLIFFYGGGLEDGSKDSLCDLAREYAGMGIAVALPSYRLFPAVSYPVFLEDAAKAVAWLKSNASEFFRCHSIFVGGHSAGAYVAMMLCFDKKYLLAHEIDSDELDGYIFASGQPTTHFNVLHFRGQNSNRVVIDEAAPIYHLRATGAPLQIFCADNDIANRLEQLNLMVSTLRCLGYSSEVDYHILKNQDHGSYLDRKDSAPSILAELSTDFIHRHSN